MPNGHLLRQYQSLAYISSPVLPSENENAVCQIAIRLFIRLHIDSFARRVAENINFLAIFRLLGVERIAGIGLTECVPRKSS